RPDLLLLGALLHDLGKGRGGDHSVVGAALAEQIGHRLGLWPSDVDILSTMVRHHLLLPHTATRRDLEDPATAQRVVDTLDGDQTVLELLVALAEADSLATGPGVWSEWRAALVFDLAERCRAVLAGRPIPAPEPVSDEHRLLAEQVAQMGSVHVSADQDAGPGAATMITIVTPGRPGVLALAAGVLALHSLQVHSAAIRVVELDSGQTAAVDTFTVSPRFGRAPDAALLRQDLIRALDGSLRLADRLAAKERDYGESADPATPSIDAGAKVLWFDDEATGAVVLELRATDRIGLLYRVAAALEGSGTTVHWARVVTWGSSVVDSFGLTCPGGDGTMTPQVRRKVECAVLSAAR
ncbi:MAG TPA: HD domain-containing protein, partial [Pseudonocardiaceae bacterium]|nr:HD domain-containing protein [Pseudonocardiaceae bacterium]